MEFDAGERAFFTEMRSLSTDNAGNEIHVGLTVEESNELYVFTRPGFSHRGSEETLGRSIELRDRHELARRSVLMAEMLAQDDKSPRH